MIKVENLTKTFGPKVAVNNVSFTVARGEVLGFVTDQTPLREAQGVAEQAQRMKAMGRLSGGIAHEFNNVLVPILLYTESAIDELPEDIAIREDLQAALQAAQRARAAPSILSLTPIRAARRPIRRAA